jgi:hypothetical protein
MLFASNRLFLPLSSLLLLSLFSLSACDNNEQKRDQQDDLQSEQQSDQQTDSDDVLKYTVPASPIEQQTGAVRLKTNEPIYNPEAVIPPQCYTKHDEQYVPCMTCHQNYAFGSRPNSMNDAELQVHYDFSDIGVENHWQNLFEDRRDRMAKISNQNVIDYIYTDNYSALISHLEAMPDWQGPIPKLKDLQLGAAAFDALGFAKDGSHWVAFNYKPLPSTFWPTNGSTDDVMIRLPAPFRQSACSEGGSSQGSSQDADYSQETYIANLAILEMTIQGQSEISLPEIDESKVCVDLNSDGVLGLTSRITQRDHYVGQASQIETNSMLYPQHTEFLHSVRYVGIDQEKNIIVPPRMKELRYMRKTEFYSVPTLRSKYGNERQEKVDGNLPYYINRGDKGTNNGFGWTLIGFIESDDGHLRLQNEEETLFCMGCHTTIGSTIDHTFAFPRKIAGAAGWGYINLKGMKDAPYAGSSNTQTEGEILHYLKTVGGGNEFRENDEMLERWFLENGSVDEAKVKQADVYTLITPSVERALELNKAYMTIVEDQDFIYGRDANLKPAVNVYQQIDPDTTPVLGTDRIKSWDIRLDWR